MNILTLDDHDVSRKGVGLYCKRIFGENTKIIEVSECRQLLEILKDGITVDMYIFDLFVEDEITLPYINLVLTKYPEAKILYLSMANEYIFGIKALKEGALGYISKLAKENELCKAIKMVFENEIYMTRELLAKTNPFDKSIEIATERFNKLSKLEVKVLAHLVKGKTTSEISKDLELKATTVSTIKSRLFEKLGTSRINEIIEIYQFNEFI